VQLPACLEFRKQAKRLVTQAAVILDIKTS